MLEILAVKRDVILVILLSLMTGSFSMFLDKCMGPGMILRRYYLFLVYHWIRNWRRGDRWKRWPLKILGLCVYCSGTWIYICTFTISAFFVLPSNLIIFAILGILGIGQNYFWIEVIQRIKR